MPRVTVLMPAYNVGPYIKESIDSVLAQTYSDFILLVIDDCSTDNTADVVQSYQDPRIRYVKNEHNVGLADNLNIGLDLIDTELMARMDGDDIAEPTWLEKSIMVLDTYPEIGICSSGFQWFGTRSSVIRYPEKNEDSMAQMLFGCTVIVPVVRMSVFRDNHLYYDKEAFPAEDYHMWARCYRVTQVYNIQETLFHYRMHASQISTSKRAAQIEKTGMVRLLMLEWLSPKFTDEDKQYFLSRFLAPESKEHLPEKFAFVERMLSLNAEVGHYDATALRNRLIGGICASVDVWVRDTYFNKGFSPLSYIHFAGSGLMHYVPRKRKMKYFVKSILFRKH